MITELPVVQVCNLNHEWTVSYYQEFHELLISDGEFKASYHKKLAWVLNSEFSDFRTQEVIGGVTFLVGYFFSRKEIRLYTPKLALELFILHELSEVPQDFREHVECVSSLDITEFPSVYQQVTHKYNLLDILNLDEYEAIKKKSVVETDKLISYMSEYRPVFFEKLSDTGLGLTAKYALLRVHLLKFLAILPSLDHDISGDEVKRILLETFRRLIEDSRKAAFLNKQGQDRCLPKSILIPLIITQWIFKFIPARPLATLVRSSVRFMAKRFIAGETIETAQKSLGQLFSSGRDVTLDQLGELVVSEKEADNYCTEVIKLIKGFGLHIPKGQKNAAGINRAHVSIKVSALCSDFRPEAPEATYEIIAPRLKKILLAAKEASVFINIDAEHYHYRDSVLRVYGRVLKETNELQDFDGTGIVLQAYLRDASEHLDEIVDLAKSRGLKMPIRLVKGAYWDAETVEADANGFVAPEFLNKEETDLHFRQMIYKIFANDPHVQLCLASHNFTDHVFAETLRDEKFPETSVIEHQCLHMTYEALSTALAKMGWPVRNYVPIGSLLVGMAYLVRRIMENSSQVGVLTIMRSHMKSSSMASAAEIHKEKIQTHQLIQDPSISHLTANFFNTPPLRLYKDEERESFDFELDRLKKRLPLVQKTDMSLNGPSIVLHSPSDENQQVGSIQFADTEDVNKAITQISDAYESSKWCGNDWQNRCFVMIRAALMMSARRNELAALIVYESGKNVHEALADVDEAIDFLNFYARQEEELQKRHENYSSRGPIAVIAPWNFPLAIPCGMVVSSLVAGNPVILKSAEQTPLIANLLVELLYSAGVPKDVLIHLPGIGETVGAKLLEDSRISGYVFTGSKTVGQLIQRKVGRRFYHNKKLNTQYPVLCITEMGGKNAIIVTQNAELDETVAGILYSSFAHAGQKCSAASRILVDKKIADRLKERLVEAIADLKVGRSDLYETAVNPVISHVEQTRLRRQVAEACDEINKYGGQVLIDRSQDNLPGFCVGPALFELPFKQSLNKESYSQKELFGPVVHLIAVDKLEQAVEIANSSDYALTGGVFSQSQDDIDYVINHMQAGNLYINRSITGARVAIEPFGGFKLSGTGPKAGGPDYIRSFHIANTRPIQVSGGRFDEGSEYEFELCRPSGLPVDKRLMRISPALQAVVRQFEMYFPGVYGDEKTHLNSFRKWLDDELDTYVTTEHPNRYIPGQVSFNNYQMSVGRLLVVSNNSMPQIENFFYFISALAMGTGITIACRSQESYEWWGSMASLFIQSGISKENMDVYFASEEIFNKTLRRPGLEHVLVDGDQVLLDKVFAEVFSDQVPRDHMVKLLESIDAPALTEFSEYLYSFIHVRALAINTMRHGAPLNLEL